MGKKSITIITGSGKGLGNGHFQRMVNLASYINNSGAFTAYFLQTDSSLVFPKGHDNLIMDKIPEGTSLILRDKRDSHPADIKMLRERAPVMVVDDAGEGRFYADYKIDLLPGLCNDTHPREDLFLYGYNFTDSIKSISNDFVEKTNDLLIYDGAFGNSSPLEKIIKYLPNSLKYKIANAEISSSYAEILISSKVILTHFGITLYEALLSRCSLAVINPSLYHKKLTDKVSGNIPLLNLVNLGQISDIDCSFAASSIVEIIEKHDTNRIEVKKLRKVIDANLQNFSDMISDIIKN